MLCASVGNRLKCLKGLTQYEYIQGNRVKDITLR